MRYPKLLKAATVLAILVLVVVILVYAKPFLVPLTFAALLSMLLLPITQWLQAKGINHALAVFLSLLMVVCFFAMVLFFLSWQITDLASNASGIEQQITSKYRQAQQLIEQKLGISTKQQNQVVKEQQIPSPGKIGSLIAGLLAGLGSFLADILLVLVYTFLFIYFRSRFKGFLVRLVADDQQGKALTIVSNARKVVQKYLTGLSLMITVLWVMYGIGFFIVGVKNALFFAVICGLLEVVPFVGNLIGTLLTLSVSLTQGGGLSLVVGILIVYGLVQFIQTYLLEPLIVGAEVSINPMFTIVGLVAGQLLWGIPGMVLAIPLLGIAKIICDHVEPLQPYAYLIGDNQKKNNKEGSGLKKQLQKAGKTVKGWFKE